MADMGQAGGGYKADVAGADHGDAHADELLGPETLKLTLADSSGSSWRNPNGLDAPGHGSTAFDLAILARAVLGDPWLAKVVRKRHAAFVTPSGRRHTLTTRSRFLLAYRGAVGVKTGFTDDAGHCLAAAATRGGRTLIAVVLHSPTTPPTPGRCSTGASARWSTEERQRMATTTGAVLALLAAVALAVHRLRQRA
jgi:hypothetical protein